MAPPAAPGGAAAGAARGDGSYWICSGKKCRQWNYCTRATCITCKAKAPPWAVRHAAVQPAVDGEGWVTPGKGKKGRAKARRAAEKEAARSAVGSAGRGSGEAPQSQGAPDAASRLAVLDRQIAHCVDFPCLPGGKDPFVEERLVALREERVQLEAEVAADKESGLSRAARLRREANSASRAERKAQGARRALLEADKAVEAAKEALDDAHAALAMAEERQQEAREKHDQLEHEAAEARQGSHQIADADLAAVRGLFMQLRTLPSAHTAGNFSIAWESTLQQMAAIETALPLVQELPAQPTRRRWGDDVVPIDDESDGGSSDDLELQEPQPAADRGQAERRGAAHGAWAKVPQSVVASLAAEAADLGPLATTAHRAAADAGARPGL